MPWRPPERGSVIVVERDGERAAVFVTERVTENNGMLTVNCLEPVALLHDMPLPFRPPGISLATDTPGFTFWWKMLMYAFDLPDPTTFPPLTQRFGADEQRVLDRFLVVADGLTRSTALSSEVKISIRPPEAGGQEQVAVQFPALDLQAGFSALLRQCHGTSNEPASYTRTRTILGRAAHESTDGHREARLAMLDAWGQAVKMLRRRSVRYLVHEAFADREGWEAFRPDAEAVPSPDSLLQTFDYGDLIHWGDRRDDVRGPDDEYAAAKQRFEFFVAAAGLAHVYIGFAELIRAATRT